MARQYRGRDVPLTLKDLIELERRLSLCDLAGDMAFTCNMVAEIVGDRLHVGRSERWPRRMSRQWGQFMHAIGVIREPLCAMNPSGTPVWLRKLHVGGKLNQLRLALVRDILKEAFNHG